MNPVLLYLHHSIVCKGSYESFTHMDLFFHFPFETLPYCHNFEKLWIADIYNKFSLGHISNSKALHELAVSYSLTTIAVAICFLHLQSWLCLCYFQQLDYLIWNASFYDYLNVQGP
jgi:hypothetical protein